MCESKFKGIHIQDWLLELADDRIFDVELQIISSWVNQPCLAITLLASTVTTASATPIHDPHNGTVSDSWSVKKDIMATSCRTVMS